MTYMTTSSLPDYARKIQQLTADSGLTQAEIARRACMNRDAYGRYHNGVTKPPADKVLAIAKVFGVKPSEIGKEFSHLEKAALVPQNPGPAYSISPAASGAIGKVYLEVGAELPVATASRIVEILVEAGVR